VQRGGTDHSSRGTDESPSRISRSSRSSSPFGGGGFGGSRCRRAWPGSRSIAADTVRSDTTSNAQIRRSVMLGLIGVVAGGRPYAAASRRAHYAPTRLCRMDIGQDGAWTQFRDADRELAPRAAAGPALLFDQPSSFRPVLFTSRCSGPQLLRRAATLPASSGAAQGGVVRHLEIKRKQPDDGFRSAPRSAAAPGERPCAWSKPC
jgi:hypothetical protein